MNIKDDKVKEGRWVNECIVTGRIIEITAKHIILFTRTAKLMVYLPLIDPLRGHKYGDVVMVTGKLYTSDGGQYPIIKKAQIIHSVEETQIYGKMQNIEKNKLKNMHRAKLIERLKSGEIMFKSVLDKKKFGITMKKKPIKVNRHWHITTLSVENTENLKGEPISVPIAEKRELKYSFTPPVSENLPIPKNS